MRLSIVDARHVLFLQKEAIGFLCIMKPKNLIIGGFNYMTRSHELSSIKKR